MKAIVYSIIGLGIIFSFFGCDELDGPTYFEETNNVIGDTINKVLIERRQKIETQNPIQLGFHKPETQGILYLTPQNVKV